jgi:hypothetical protein
MEETPNLALPYIMAAQAQKHVTHNEAIRALDALVQLTVLDRDLSAPPGGPADGARFIVAASPTGAWADQAGNIAAWQDGAWQFYVPSHGWLAWVTDEDALLSFDGADWVTAVTGGGESVPLLGISTTADTTNRLAVASDATLFTHDGADHQMKINKAAAGDTASQLFQTDFSGRAEFGLTGDDDFHVKVSPDGTNWFEALIADRSTGEVSFPNTTLAGAGRELLTADRTYYVRSDGSDSNDGLTNSSGGAFLTLQKAFDVVGALDLATFQVTIQIGDGTYTGAVAVDKPWVGGALVLVQGNTGTPANVLLSVTSNHVFHVTVPLPCPLRFKSFEGRTTSSGDVIRLEAQASVECDGVRFGACAGAHARSMFPGARIDFIANYTISGGAMRHWYAQFGVIRCQSRAVTLSGTPAFSSQFATADNLGGMQVNANTFSGSATGTRYTAAALGLINTGGGGASYLPGDGAGSTSGGGQYL